MIKIILMLLVIFLSGISVFAEEVNFVASLDDFIYGLEGVPLRIKSFNSIQGAPKALKLEPFSEDADLTNQYRLNSISFVRIPQDDGFGENGLSLASIFPDPDADPDLPASYHFKNIDQYLKSIVDSGASVLWEAIYDIGITDSWTKCCQQGKPPGDLRKWKEVVKHCLAHFNRGWANGHDFQIKYAEFINEPCGLGGFDCRSDEGRVVLAKAIQAFSEAITEYNNEFHDSVNVVCCSEIAGHGLWKIESELVMRPILKFIKNNNLKLDVFSFHQYDSPEMIIGDIKERRKVLEQEGFAHVPVWLTEWNTGVYPQEVRESKDLAMAFRGSHNVAVKILAQDYLDEAFLYRAGRPSGPMSRKDDLPVFARYFDLLTGEQLLDSFSWKFFDQMKKETPLRVRIKNSEKESFSVPNLLVGQSSDREKIGMIMAYWGSDLLYGIKDKIKIKVVLQNVLEAKFKLTQFVVDSKKKFFKPVKVVFVRPNPSGAIVINSEISLWSYQYYFLEKQD